MSVRRGPAPDRARRGLLSAVFGSAKFDSLRQRYRRNRRTDWYIIRYGGYSNEAVGERILCAGRLRPVSRDSGGRASNSMWLQSSACREYMCSLPRNVRSPIPCPSQRYDGAIQRRSIAAWIHRYYNGMFVIPGREFDSSTSDGDPRGGGWNSRGRRGRHWTRRWKQPHPERSEIGENGHSTSAVGSSPH